LNRNGRTASGLSGPPRLKRTTAVFWFGMALKLISLGC
jgi:hypothetical protein